MRRWADAPQLPFDAPADDLLDGLLDGLLDEAASDGPDAAPGPTAADGAPRSRFRVEVRRSAKRRRTVGARVVDGVLVVLLPAWMSAEEEAHWVAEMSRRFERRRVADDIDLPRRTSELARRHDLPRPAEVRWVSDMTTRWASCTPATRTIRVSDRLAAFPAWVLDYVLVHELAHLVVPDHSPAFWSLVHRYPRAERAIGFLIAVGHGAGHGATDDDGLD